MGESKEVKEATQMLAMVLQMNEVPLAVGIEALVDSAIRADLHRTHGRGSWEGFLFKVKELYEKRKREYVHQLGHAPTVVGKLDSDAN